MNFAWLFLSCLFFLAVVEYREVNGFAFDDLDFARSAIEDVAKSIISTKPATKIPKLTSVSFSHRPMLMRHKSWGADSLAKVSSSQFGISKAKPLSKKPRNLNKFNEAMDQVERAMAQAELSRKTVKLSDLKIEIIEAVKRGNVR